MMTHSLQELLAAWAAAVAGTDLPAPPAYSGPDYQLSGFCEDSREAGPGTLFVARVRLSSDGHRWIGPALANGARLVMGQQPLAELGLELPEGATYWQVPDTAIALAWLAAAFYGFPARQLVMIGVTGSDGKTTTSSILYAILRHAGIAAGLISTVHAAFGDQIEHLPLHVTTPEAPLVQQYLRRLVDGGFTHCVLEATSHGLDQHRVGAIHFDLAAVTNINHEHLDYHGSWEAYFAAKARLFQNLALPRVPNERFPFAARKLALLPTAVLNRDDRSYEGLAAIDVPQQFSYGIESEADFQARGIMTLSHVTRFELAGPAGPPYRLESPLVGYFNVYNLLAAAALATALGLSPAQIQAGAAALAQVTGRMQRIDKGQPFLVIVDFAHTPGSLEQAIRTAARIRAEQGSGRIITVFGSAGKRDVAKRSLMAAISAREADLTVLTAEDPRTESLDDILATMAAGCAGAGAIEGESFWRIPDRGWAIWFALNMAQPDDILLICGKGHEQSMCFGTVEYPWDDRAAARAALAAWARGETMTDLGLPTF